MEKNLVAYILWRTGCIHPFRISRILALAELYFIEENNKRMTSLKYVKGPGVFYIEGLKELLESDPCFRRNEEKHCMEYVCGEPSIDEVYKRYLDRAIEQANGLDDRGLNDLVVKHRFYEKLFT